jgi:hypothetical protein
MRSMRFYQIPIHLSLQNLLYNTLSAALLLSNRGSTSDPTSKMTYLRLPLDVGSSLPRHLLARILRHLLHQQVDALLRAPARRPRRGWGSAGYARHGSRRDDGAAARSNDSSTLATRCGSPVLPNNYTAPDRFPVESPRRCDSHGLTARVRLHLVGLQQENVVDPASPHRAISLVASPEYTPASPERTPTPVGPPGFFIIRTMAARTGALPFYNNLGGGSSSASMTASPNFIDLEPPSPPPPPASWAPGRQTAAAAVNRHPRLRPRPNWILTGHIPAGNGTGGSGPRPSPSGEAES